MDTNSLGMLEFPKIKEILANFTSFSASRELAVTLTPSTSTKVVSLLLKQSAEARHLLALKPGFSVGSVHDIRELATEAAKGKVLEPLTLLEIKETLAASRIVSNSLKKLSQELPELWKIGIRVKEKPDIENAINKCITSAGEIADSASEKLSDLRYQLKETRQRLHEKLDTLLKSKTHEKFIQDDPYITEREGRYVIPIKSDFRKEIKGIVHDVSNTGATVFVEPWETVEMGNEIRQYVVGEKQEIDRILSSLSAQIGAHQEDICRNVELLAEIDLAVAKAKFAEKYNAIEAVLSDSNEKDRKKPVLKLAKARHPLLRGKIVPLDIEIGQDYSVLIITGPNTGGKTLALKTMGLLTLMTQAGLPIPASEESIVPVFDGVFADIGDQQSIEQTLSTFSWHVGNIIHIIKSSTQNSLVLLDELGISTDPEEGSALAKAILLSFLKRGTTTVATTHYSDLKAFAHTTEGMKNASLDFNPATMVPTYHLTIGIPGRSNALSMASQLGLDQEIIAEARKMLSSGTREMDKLLSDMVREKQKLESIVVQIEDDRKRAEELRNHLEKESQRLKEQERVMLQETKDRLLRDAADLQRLVRETESELRKSKKKESLEQAKKALAELHEKMSGEAWRVKTGIGEGAGDGIVVGDRVKIVERNLEGIVLSLVSGGTQVEVQVGNFKLTVGKDEIQKVSAPASVRTSYPLVKRRQSKNLHSLELDLRGKHHDEVSGLLDRYLNDAFLANLGSVRVIHGYATGTVRQVVRELLSSHPLVKSFQPGGKDEGGDGVTVVQL
jgi:DNA mismatch repair protein MutS2